MIIAASRPHKGLSPLEYGLIASLVSGAGVIALLLSGML
jgi:hypothetical protein